MGVLMGHSAQSKMSIIIPAVLLIIGLIVGLAIGYSIKPAAPTIPSPTTPAVTTPPLTVPKTIKITV